MENVINQVEKSITPENSSRLLHIVEHAAHLLPAQGPIDVFVHHNTLHAFEDYHFDQAVMKGHEVYGCEPYLSEERYRAKLKRGRFTTDDLFEVLLDDLGDEGHVLIGFMGTRFHLRLAMLEHSLHTGPVAELRWVISETDALSRFRKEASITTKERMIDQTRRWVMRDLTGSQTETDPQIREVIKNLFERFNSTRIDSWNNQAWEAFTLRLLWEVCYIGAESTNGFSLPVSQKLRHRDLLVEATGCDIDDFVNEVLIRFCAAFLDQGFSNWALPDRDAGFFAAFKSMFRSGKSMEWWLRGLPEELKRIEQAGMTPVDVIADSLQQLGLPAEEHEAYITQTLLALRGWAGMIWQMETNAEWTVRPAPSGTLVEYLAVRLLLERFAISTFYQQETGSNIPLEEVYPVLKKQLGHSAAASADERAYLLFQLAQVRGWCPSELHQQTGDAWTRLIKEIETFNGYERRRIYHLAYERRYRHQTLDAVAIHARQACTAREQQSQVKRASFQLITCIDDREESFRRHLEEVVPSCETFAAAGFYAVAMYFRGVTDAHFRPLCPVSIKPDHYVTEEVAYSLTASSRSREDARRILGAASHRWHIGSRTLMGGIVTSVLGSLASIPMVTRILFPRLTAQARKLFGSIIQPPAVTELHLHREAESPGPEDSHLGYSLEEMADIVERILQDIGLTENMSRLIVFVGHGSGSLNNPHESAYNCGACSGGRGGPNARAFSQMANDPRIRKMLAERGLVIPEDTVFVGVFHNTCDEDVSYYDLDSVPRSHRKEFEQVRAYIDQARARNAHERCRRFESADLAMPVSKALEHVEGRAEDLSQARPEYNHATDALCFVGRRDWSRNLFLDRRAFLTSYDPTQDDGQASILARILAAAVPVCAGINLEYYFSTVDPDGYGCGSKLPHNVTALLGVMEGAASDMRPGLSRQMVEIHEPVRILFVIETTAEKMLRIMQDNPTIDQLVRNQWVQLAILNPDSNAIHVFHQGEFQLYNPETTQLPQVESSFDWYRGQRDHLGYAQIVQKQGKANSSEPAVNVQDGEVA